MARPRTANATLSLLVCIVALSTLARAELPPDFECPTSIDATIPDETYREHEDPLQRPYGSMQNLYLVMSRCSNITDLKLRLALLGCTGFPDRHNFPFDQQGTSSFPSRLTRLSLEGYFFEAKQWDSNKPPTWRSLLPGPGALYEWDKALTWFFGGEAVDWFRMWGLPEEQRGKNNLELWIDAMDFSAVSNLTLHDAEYTSQADAVVRSLPGQLPALKALEIKGSWAYDFLKALPKHSLSHLKWKSSSLLAQENPQSHLDTQNYPYEEELNLVNPIAGKSLYDIWDHIGGPQLESFEFRDEDGVEGYPSEMLSTDHLHALSASAPNLRNLNLEFKRSNNSWPEKELALIAREFPALESLTLYLELASECRQRDLSDDFGYKEWRAKVYGSQGEDCFGEDQFMKPLVNESSASQLFNFVRRVNVEEGGGKLRELNLFAGDWARPWDGPLYFPGWLEGKRAWASCSIGNSGQGLTSGIEMGSPLCKAEDRRLGYEYDD